MTCLKVYSEKMINGFENISYIIYIYIYCTQTSGGPLDIEEDVRALVQFFSSSNIW